MNRIYPLILLESFEYFKERVRIRENFIITKFLSLWINISFSVENSKDSNIYI
jgi:hypothetical protein